jgi:hypothetical protein
MPTDDYGDIEVALVVSIGALRRVLRTLHVQGREWWIASDPYDAKQIGWISLGWGNRHCTDPANVEHFRIPILDSAEDEAPGKLLVLFDASCIVSEDRHFRSTLGSSVGGFEEFFTPVKAALVACLHCGFTKEERS